MDKEKLHLAIGKFLVKTKQEEDLVGIREKFGSIDDPVRLATIWEDTPVHSTTEVVIEKRIIDLILDINPNNVPDWFINVLDEDSTFLPTSSKQAVRAKAREIETTFRG